LSNWREMLGADVLTLGMAADQARRAQANGRVVTYVRVHTVTPAELEAGLPIPDAASEVRLYAAPESLDDAIEQVRALRAVAGSRRVTAFSMADLQGNQWGNTPDALNALAGAGWDDVAELPADRIEDLPAAIRRLRAAGLNPQRITMAEAVGDRRVDIITRVQSALATDSGVRRFAPLPRVAPADKPTTGYDDVRMVALARLAVGPASIEVDWGLYGPKLAQVALTFGADHLDAVPATDNLALGRRRATVEDVERNIKAAGFEPREDRPVR
jgi:hypothetical protein